MPEAAFDLHPVSLSAVELSGLLTAVAVAGVRPADDRTLSGLVRSLWLKLYAADRQAAHGAFTDAVRGGASLEVILDLAALLDLEDKVHDTTKGTK